MQTNLFVECLTGAPTPYHFQELRQSGSLWLDGYYMDPTLSEAPLGDTILVRLSSGSGGSFDPVDTVVAAPRNGTTLRYANAAAAGIGLVCANPLKTYVALTRPVLISSKLPDAFSAIVVELRNGRTDAALTVSATGSTLSLLTLHLTVTRRPTDPAALAAQARHTYHNNNLNALARFNEY